TPCRSFQVITFPPSERVHDSASWGTSFWSLSHPTRPSNITLCTIIEGTSPVLAGSSRAASAWVASRTPPPPDWAPAASTKTPALNSTAAAHIQPRLRNRWFMIASLVLRGARLDPSQEAEIVVMLHLPDEARNGLDGARYVVEIDDLVGRVGVPSRHPDADGRNTVPAQMDRGRLRGSSRQVCGELQRHALTIGGLQEIALHRRMSDAPTIVAGRVGEDDDRPASHDDGDVAGGARVRGVAGRRAVDRDGAVGPQPVRGHGGAPQPDLFEHRAHGVDGAEGLDVLELSEHLDEDGHARAIRHALAAHAMLGAEVGEPAHEGDGVAHPDAQRGDIRGAGCAHVDVHVGHGGRPCLLLRRLQVASLRADDAEVAVDGDAPARQEGVGGSAQAIEAQKPIRLDALHDEPDLVEVGADHQPRSVLTSAAGRGDVAVAVDFHGVGQWLHAPTGILDEGLLESGSSVESHQIPQRVAGSIFDCGGTVGHGGTLYGSSPGAVKGRIG